MHDDLLTPEEHIARALAGLGFGDDPEMARTPELFAAMLAEWRPMGAQPAERLPTASHDVVVIRDLPFYSLCAHHLLPFFGTCTIALRPAGLLVGFGWFARMLSALAQQPQIQERLAAEIADAIEEAVQPSSLAVRLEARHMCVEMRGARSAGEFRVMVTRGNDDEAVLAVLSGA